MIYLCSFFPLVIFYGDPHKFWFYFKIIALIHIYRETGRFLLAFTNGFHFSRTGYLEYKSFKDLSRFSLEIITGLFAVILLYYAASQISHFYKSTVFIYLIRIPVYIVSVAGFLIQIRIWIRQKKGRNGLHTQRLWQGIYVYMLYFSILAFSLIRIAGHEYIASLDDYYHIMVAKVYTYYGLYSSLEVSGNFSVSYPSVYGVCNALQSILVFNPPAEAVHSEPLIINITLIFLFIHLLTSVLKMHSFYMYLIFPLVIFLMPVYVPEPSYSFAPRFVFPLLSLNLILLLYTILFYLKRKKLQYTLLSGGFFTFILLLNPSCIPHVIVYFWFFILTFIWQNHHKPIRYHLRFILPFILISSVFLMMDPYYSKITSSSKKTFNREELPHHITDINRKRFDFKKAIMEYDYGAAGEIKGIDSYARRHNLPFWFLGLLFLFFLILIQKKYLRLKSRYKDFFNFFIFFSLTIFFEKIAVAFFTSGLFGKEWDTSTLIFYLKMNRISLDEIYYFALIFLFAGSVDLILNSFLYTKNFFTSFNSKSIINLTLVLSTYLIFMLTLPESWRPVKNIYSELIPYRMFSSYDVKLTHWIKNQNLDGAIGLQGKPYPSTDSDILIPYEAGAFYELHSSDLNYTFTRLDPLLTSPYSFFKKNVENWNLQALKDKKIRYWIINKNRLIETPYLTKAIKEGFLLEDKCFQESCLFHMK